MNDTVWTVPLDYFVTEGKIEAMKAWCAEQGIDVHNTAREGFHITRNAATGLLTAHYSELLRDEHGARYTDHPSGEYAKRPASTRVTSLPNL